MEKKSTFWRTISYFLELDTELYDRILALPFIPSKEKSKEILREVENSPNIKKENKTYLKKLDEYKEKWALAYRKDDYIIGVQTTSRIESLHALMKKFIRSKCGLTELFYRLVEFAHGKNTQQIGKSCKSYFTIFCQE